jgi:hypothetical protein
MKNFEYFEIIIGYDLGQPIIHRIYINDSTIERNKIKSSGKPNKGFPRVKIVKMYHK